jgi:hypothetical protein
MRKHRSIETVRVALAAALGLSSFSCGDQTTASSSEGGSDNPPASNINQPDATMTTEGGSDNLPASNINRPDATTTTNPTTPESGTPTAIPPPNGGARFPCVDPTPLIVGGKDTG